VQLAWFSVTSSNIVIYLDKADFTKAAFAITSLYYWKMEISLTFTKPLFCKEFALITNFSRQSFSKLVTQGQGRYVALFLHE
jgi:hypothetical protein